MNNSSLISGKHWLKKKRPVLAIIMALMSTPFYFFYHPMPVYAQQNVKFEVTVDKTEVALGDTVELTLMIIGNMDTSKITPPPIEGFQMRYIGPYTSTTIVNGSISKRSAYRYALTPSQIGTFTIPSLTIGNNQQRLSSDPITINVVAETEETQALKKRLFLDLDVTKDTVYVGQKIPVTIRLFVQDVPFATREYPKIESTNFITDDMPSQPRQFEKIISGLHYTIVEYQSFVYPTTAGQITLGPVTLNGNILYESSSFNSFFNMTEKRPVVIGSQPVILNVLDLPKTNKPANFAEAIGDFDFNITASPTDVTVGDPITIRMTVSGEGNTKTIRLPEYKEDQLFKAYDPQIKTENGKKILEQVIIPRFATIKEIPAQSFHYFNPNTKRYESIVQGPFPVTITPAATPTSTASVIKPLPTKTTEPEILGQDIIFIKDQIGQISQKGRYLYHEPIFKWILVLAICFYVLGLILYARRQRLQTDQAYAKRLRAPKQAHNGLAKARQLLKSQNIKDVYDTLYTTTETYFIHKFYLRSGHLSLRELTQLLQNKNVDESIIKTVTSLYETCDRIRYASGEMDAQQAKDVLKQCEQIIDYCERKVK